MRKVTKAMALKLNRNENGKMGNTQVKDSAMYLHGNRIVDLQGNRILILSSCGWQTSTTKERLNGVLEVFHLPYKIYQKNFQWFVFNTETKESVEFRDNFTLPLF